MTEKMTATIDPRAAAILTGLLHCESCELTDDGGARWRMSHGITIEMKLDPIRWHVGVTPPAPVHVPEPGRVVVTGGHLAPIPFAPQTSEPLPPLPRNTC